MRSCSACSSFAALLSLVVVAACGGDPPPSAKQAPDVAGSEAPAASPSAPGPEWDAATKGAETSSAEACDVARSAVLAEKGCVGSLCAHGAALANEWADRCGKASTSADGVRSIAKDLAERSKTAPSKCGDRFEAVLKSGCGRDMTCEATVGRWAARCAKSDGSPLVLGLLTRIVAHKAALPDMVLDLRGCDELRAALGRGVTCDKASCAAAVKSVQTYRTRCEGDGVEQPSAATIAIETAILAAAGQVTVPTVVKPDSPKLTTNDMPVLLSDGWGAIAAVCDERPADTAHYLASRRACENGKIVLVRIFATVAKDVDVRAGALDAPDDVTFTRRFPSLRVAGEIEARDADAKLALDADLKKTVELAKDPAKAPDAARVLVRAVNQAAFALARSAPARAVLAAADDALGPALAVIGEAKLAAAKDLAGIDLAGLAARAVSRPFADVGEDGVLAIGGPAAASRLDGATLLPHAMAAYTAALGDLARLAKRKPLSAADARDAKTRATDAAKACAAADKRAQAAERDLIACAFAVNPCPPAKIETLSHALDDDRATVSTAHKTIDTSASALPAALRAAVEKAAAVCP